MLRSADRDVALLVQGQRGGGRPDHRLRVAVTRDQEHGIQQPGQAVVPVPASADHAAGIHQDQGCGQVPGQLEELVEGVLGRGDHR